MRQIFLFIVFKQINICFFRRLEIVAVGGKFLSAPQSDAFLCPSFIIRMERTVEHTIRIIHFVPVTEAVVNSWLVMIVITGLCLFLTHGTKDYPELKRQHFAEIAVEMVDKLVNENMGDYFSAYGPFIMSILELSAFSSLMSLFGLFPPTSDLNVVAGWAILIFGIITYYKFKCGPVNYLKGFTKPVIFLAPINFISEFATPISMAFRHYGNVLSGVVVSVLVGSALQGVSAMLLSWAPEFLASIPVFQVGIPAVLSVYFDGWEKNVIP